MSILWVQLPRQTDWREVVAELIQQIKVLKMFECYVEFRKGILEFLQYGEMAWGVSTETMNGPPRGLHSHLFTGHGIATLPLD